MNGKYCIGIDIGGTKVNIGIVNEDGTILDKVKIPTCKKDPNISDSQVWKRKNREPEEIIKAICNEIQTLLQKNQMTMNDIYFIGAGVPGTADTKTGMVSYCPNLFWYDVPAGELFETYLHREVKIMQDSRNAALAEMLFGAGREYNDILCISVGTGVGCGIISDRKIYNGAMNTAGEFGHTPIVKDGRQCVCGNKGCLERYVSGTAIYERAFEKFPWKFEKEEQKNSEYVFEMAYNGDAEILEYIDECVDYLAFGIANAVCLMAPEAIIISGGLCVHDELFVKPLREKVMQRGYYSWTRLNSLKICKAELGSDAAMIGAAMLYKGI